MMPAGRRHGGIDGAAWIARRPAVRRLCASIGVFHCISFDAARTGTDAAGACIVFGYGQDISSFGKHQAEAADFSERRKGRAPFASSGFSSTTGAAHARSPSVGAF